MAELSAEIARVERLAKAGKNGEAMSIADRLVEQHPGETEVLCLRAYLHALNQNFELAIGDLVQAIETNPCEPALFYDLGIDRLRLGDDMSAVRDFSEGLALCDLHQNDYYREPLHFFRAEAFLRQGKKDEALADLAQVSEDFRSWTIKLRTKAEMLKECDTLLD